MLLYVLVVMLFPAISILLQNVCTINTAVIEQVYSTADKDGDGIDDQTDILQGALDYIASKPKYKSKYYQTGYPDDGYGVCINGISLILTLYANGYITMDKQ